MRLNHAPLIISASLFVGFASQAVFARAEHNLLKSRGTSAILINPPHLPELPTVQEAAEAAAEVGLNQTNIQGDILVGMHKNKELFFFFGINDAATFKSKLASDIYPLITSIVPLLPNYTGPEVTTAVNIAFSYRGLTTLGINDLNDTVFVNGQFSDANNLGDQAENWVPGLAGAKVHGVLLLASNTLDNVDSTLASITTALGSSIVEIHRLQGEARPGNELGHEHFGFADGISQPAVKGFNLNPLPGQVSLDASNFLLGQTGDAPAPNHPPWAKDGSFLAFRQLKQLVPEFNKFLTDNPIVHPELTPAQGSALLGSRMVGRWKSGAPNDLAPLFDDPALGNDTQRNNNFNFTSELSANNQTLCPFSAHIRKTFPRGDLSAVATDPHHIIRAAIPYGPEVSDEEAASNKSSDSLERGLAFVAYQSDITQGFQFLQEKWANNIDFVRPGVGFDPIIGTNNQGRPRDVFGLDPFNPTNNTPLVTNFVVSRGGEYFFSPSLSAIVGTLAV